MRTPLLVVIAGCLIAAAPAAAASMPASPPLLQAWSDIGLIAADDDWSGVPAIVGHRGDGLAAEPGADPRTVVADGAATPVDVSANRPDPRAVALPAGVAEFELANPVVAIQGSATASAPHLVLSLDTRSRARVSVRLVLRDVDASAADAIQPVAMQYRVGEKHDYATLPGGYVADATTGPGEATLSTPVRVMLPAAANDRPLVQVRVITTNATGQDEWVGVDDVEVTAASAAGECPDTGAGPPAPGDGPGTAPGTPPGSRPKPIPRPRRTPRPAPDRGRPLAIRDLVVAPETFTPTGRGPAILRGPRAPRGGAKLRFRLTRAALVRFVVEGAAAPSRFAVRARRGLNRLRFSGRVRGRALAPGSYVLRAVAADRRGRESEPVTARFRIGPEAGD